MQPEPAEGVPLTPAPMPPFPQVTGAGTGTANATTHHKALKPSSPSSPSSPRYYVRVLDNRGFGQPDPA